MPILEVRGPDLLLPERGPSGAAGVNGLFSMTPLVKSGAYTVGNSDKGKSLALTTDTQYALTLGAAGSYDSDFAIWLWNTSALRSKDVILTGGTNFRLWPRQAALVAKPNGVWETFLPGRWKHPGGALTLFTNYDTGLDTADGLSALEPKKTIREAAESLLNDVDFNGSTPTISTISCAEGVEDQEALHFSPHAMVGGHGGNTINIVGEGTGGVIAPTGAEHGCIEGFYGLVLQVENMILDSSGSSFVGASCIATDLGATIYFSDITFRGAAASGSHFNLNRGGTAYAIGNWTIESGALAHILAGSKAVFVANGFEPQITGNSTFGNFINCSIDGLVNFLGSGAIGLDTGVTVTGTRFIATYGGRILTGGGVSDLNYFPGNVGGTYSKSYYDLLIG